MNKWLLRHCGRHYLLLTLFGTRIFGAAGGLGVIYYVQLSLEMSPEMRLHFELACLAVVLVAIVLTLLMALRETRHLRPVLRATLRGQPVDPAQAIQAAKEAVMFPARHHRNEAWMVPLATLLPVLVVLKVVDNAPNSVLINITIAAFMATSLALMSHFLAMEYFITAVIEHLLDFGVNIPYESLPSGRLDLRFGLCFSLIILTTALMIGTLARQRASDIVQGRLDHTDALQTLITHSTYITIVAVIVGIVLTTVLTRSVSARLGRLVYAMERVGSGNMSERLRPTGNDEIDFLGRKFDAMVEEISKHDATINSLNANLERMVVTRTQQLENNVNQLRETQSQLIHAEKMNSLGQLVAGVAHELNNSINAVYNGIRPLQWKLDELGTLVFEVSATPTSGQEPRREKMQQAFKSLSQLASVIEHGASRTARIVSDLKTFSHPGREEIAPLDLNEVVEMSLSLLTTETKTRIQLHKHYGELKQVYGPRNQISQVLLNILNNAQQAIAGTGEIYITTRQGDDASCVSVRDTGLGIPEAIRDRIFDPFFTTKEPGVGTGLGLSISYSIIKNLGGSIECFSPPGEGAEFVIRLPNQQPKIQSEKPRQPAAQLA